MDAHTPPKPTRPDDDAETPREPGFEDHRDLMSAQSRKDILAGTLSEQSVACMWGLPGANKSLIVLTWLLACTFGSNYNGKPARRGLCVYLAWEGSRRLTGERKEAWKRYYRYAPAEVDGLKTQHFSDLADKDMPLRDSDLFSTNGRERLANRIAAEAEPYGGTVIVVFDTGTSLVQGMRRKHSQQAWTDVAVLVRWLSSHLKCCCLVLLHAKKNGAEPSGAVSYLLADTDTIMHCVADPEGSRTKVEVLKQRGGPAGQKYIFDIVPVELPSELDPSQPAQPVAVLRGLAEAAEPTRPPTRRELATLDRDSMWLMRLAEAMVDGERSPPSPILLRAWGDDGGEQFKRLRRLVPLDKGVTLRVPEESAMKHITLIVEDSEERLCCSVRPEVVGGKAHQSSFKPFTPPTDLEPQDHLDGDDAPVPTGHMTPRETRWFLWFSPAFTDSGADQRRYSLLVRSMRWPVFTQDREAAIKLLHDCVANSVDDVVRERARVVLGKLGIVVPPPIETPQPPREPPLPKPSLPEEPLPEEPLPEPPLPEPSPKRKRGRPLGSKNRPPMYTAPKPRQEPPPKRKRGRPLGSKNRPPMYTAPKQEQKRGHSR